MIKEIIKRDGSVEPYIAKKVNSWGRWATQDVEKHVDWSGVVIDTVSSFHSRAATSELQEKLIQTCLDKGTWSYYLMAGRLYASHLHKTIYGKEMPHLKAVHERMVRDGIMIPLDYSQEEYEATHSYLQHERDYQTPHFALHYIRKKYSLQNRSTGQEYETQQFVYMRMAMALAENEEPSKRLALVKNFYEYFSNKIISAPTPNFVNLGTRLRGFASCCVYIAGDTEASLAIGDHIAYRMTAASSGIGCLLLTRSKGDPVRGGLVEHQGKLPYFASLGKAVKANMQTGRGGACTTYYSGFDPEAEVIAHLRNPRSTENKKNRDLHYALITNKFFAKKVAKNEEAFSFNIQTAPRLTDLLFSDDSQKFEEEYNRLLLDKNFAKTFFNPRCLTLTWLNEALETGVAYLVNIDEINKHTPFKEPIHSSNLCLEILEPNRPYLDMRDLYSDKEVGFVILKTTVNEVLRLNFNEKILTQEGHAKFAGELAVQDKILYNQQKYTIKEIVQSYPEPEIALCSLGAIAVDEVQDDKAYEEAMYLTLKMIDYCIENSHYVLPHVGVTAKKRMNAGVGIMGLATYMAKKNLKYSSKEGLAEIHRVAERHMYFAIKASLRISKERGVAEWMHKTKWPEGWLPIDTYNKNVDELGDFQYQYDWEALRKEIVQNGGIGHSCLVAYMPGESSSKALGKTNSVYPVRDKTLNKTDNSITIRWAAPFSDNEDYHYESAWDISENDMLKVYAVIQKFTDQGISADLWRRIKDDTNVGSSELLSHYFTMIKYGVKTRYYYNSNVASDKTLNGSGSIETQGTSCDGCTL